MMGVEQREEKGKMNTDLDLKQQPPQTFYRNEADISANNPPKIALLVTCTKSLCAPSLGLGCILPLD
jgi:hypothetical protein